MKKILFLVPFLLLGCSGEQEDLKAWMEKETAGMRGQVKPLPEMEPFPSVDYEGFALVHPSIRRSSLLPRFRSPQVVYGRTSIVSGSRSKLFRLNR